jgi:MYXO-CTERM domain-containing protein
MRSLRLLALAFSALTASASPAFGHGRFPEAGQIVVDPSDPATIYVRTTYGLLSSRDAGKVWYWTCPDAIGFDANIEDPALVVLADGTLVVGTFGGLSVSSQEACQFDLVGGDLIGRNFKDVQPEADPSHALAISSNCKSDLSCEVRLWASPDDAKSWSEIGAQPPSDFLALSLGVAPSDPARIYLTGKNQPPLAPEGSLMRSDDRGQSWTRLSIPGTHDDALAYMGGVDPGDPDRLYVGRVETDPGDKTKVLLFALLVSEDGGESFQTAFERSAGFAGFALSPDGARVALSGRTEGLWLAEASTMQFAKISEVHASCLTWTEVGIYACTDQFLDGFNVGLSSDDGKTFMPLSELGSPCGSPAWCAPSTTVGAECPGRWVQEKVELGAPGCDDPTTGGGPAPPPLDEPTCGCQTAPAGGAGAWPALALLAVFGRRRLSAVRRES